MLPTNIKDMCYWVTSYALPRFLVLAALFGWFYFYPETASDYDMLWGYLELSLAIILISGFAAAFNSFIIFSIALIASIVISVILHGWVLVCSFFGVYSIITYCVGIYDKRKNNAAEAI